MVDGGRGRVGGPGDGPGRGASARKIAFEEGRLTKRGTSEQVKERENDKAGGGQSQPPRTMVRATRIPPRTTMAMPNTFGERPTTRPYAKPVTNNMATATPLEI